MVCAVPRNFGVLGFYTSELLYELSLQIVDVNFIRKVVVALDGYGCFAAERSGERSLWLCFDYAQHDALSDILRQKKNAP